MGQSVPRFRCQECHGALAVVGVAERLPASGTLVAHPKISPITFIIPLLAHLFEISNRADFMIKLLDDICMSNQPLDFPITAVQFSDGMH